MDDILERIQAFTDEMSGLGIHVGINGVCAVCQTSWPCVFERGPLEKPPTIGQPLEPLVAVVDHNAEAEWRDNATHGEGKIPPFPEVEVMEASEARARTSDPVTSHTAASTVDKVASTELKGMIHLWLTRRPPATSTDVYEGMMRRLLPMNKRTTLSVSGLCCTTWSRRRRCGSRIVRVDHQRADQRTGTRHEVRGPVSGCVRSGDADDLQRASCCAD